MKYYSLLKSTAPSDVLSIPIGAVLTKVSVEASTALSKPRVYRNGAFTRKYQSIGDLLALGYDGTYDVLSQYNYTSDQKDEMLYCIEEGLASIGLKFKNSEFSVGDVRLKHIGLGDEIMSALKKSRKSPETIDDLIIFGRERFEALPGMSASNDLRKVNKALERYGVKMEGAGYSIDRTKQFPLDLYSEYLTESKPRDFADGKVKSKYTFEELKTLDKETLLKQDVACLNLYKNSLAKIEEENIETIGDLLKKGYMMYVQLGLAYYITLKQKLAELGLKFEGASYEIENGKVIRTEPPSQLMSEYAKKPFDFQTASEEEKVNFMRQPLKNWGIAVGLYNAVSGKCKTVGDLAAYLKRNTGAITGYTMSRLKACFKLYNISIDEPKVSKAKKTLVHLKQLLSEGKFADLDEEGKARRLNQKLCESALDVEFAEEITRVLGVTTIGELHEVPRNKIKASFDEKKYHSICDFMSLQGLKLKTEVNQAYNHGYKGVQEEQPVIDFETLDDQQKEEFLQNSVMRLGISTRMAMRLSEKLGIKTIEDLVSVTKRTINANLGPKAAHGVMTAVEKFNMHMKVEVKPTAQEKKRAELLVRLKDASRNTRSAKEIFIPDAQGRDKTSDETKEIVKNTKIEDIGLSKPIIDALKNNQIFTIGELLNLSRAAITNITGNRKVAPRLERLLAEYDLKFRPNSAPRQLQSISATEGASELGELYHTSVSDLGLNEEDARALRNQGIRNFGGIIEHSYFEIEDMFDDKLASTLCDIVASKGLVFRPRSDASANKYGDFEDQQLAKRFSEMSDEQKKKLLVFENSGLHQLTVERLRDAGMKSVADLDGKTISEVHEIIHRHYGDMKQIKFVLGLNGMELKAFKEAVQPKYDSNGQPICDALDGKDVEEIKKQPVTVLDIGKRYVDALLRSGIKTMGDFEECKRSQIDDLISSHEKCQYILKLCDKYGIKLKQRNARQTTQMGIKNDIPSALDGVSFNALSDEEKQHYLDLPLTTFTFIEPYKEKFESLGIFTIGDFLKHKQVEMNSKGISDGVVRRARRVLNVSGAIKYFESLSLKGRKRKVERKPVEKTFDKMTETEKEEFLNRDISVIDLSNANIQKLKGKGVSTIKDLSKFSQSELQNIGVSGNACTVISVFFSSHKVYRKHERSREYNVSALEKYPLDERLELPLESLDLSEKQVDSFHKTGIFKVGDLGKITTGLLWGICNSPRFIDYISKVKESCNIEVERTPAQRMNDYLKLVWNKQFNELDEKEKQEILSISLYDAGIGKISAENLKSVGIVTIGDAAKSTYSLVKEASSCEVSNKVKMILNVIGLDFVKARELNHEKKKAKITADEFSALSAEEKEKALDKNIEDFGVNINLENLHERDINTMRDILETDSRDLYDFLGIYGFRVISTTCQAYGLKLDPRQKSNRREYIESIPKKPISEMTEEEKQRVYGFSLKHLFSFHAVQKLKSEGFYTIGDILKVDYDTFMKRSKNSISFKRIIQEICERFDIDYIPDDKKVINTAKANANLTKEEQYFIDQGFDPRQAKKLHKLGYTTMEDLQSVPHSKLKEELGHSAYDKVMHTLARRRLLLAEQEKEKESENSLFEKLKERGVSALSDIPEKDFEEGSGERESIETALEEYYKWYYETKIFVSPTEKLLLESNLRLEKEKEIARGIIEAKTSKEQPEDVQTEEVKANETSSQEDETSKGDDE